MNASFWTVVVYTSDCTNWKKFKPNTEAAVYCRGCRQARSHEHTHEVRGNDVFGTDLLVFRNNTFCSVVFFSPGLPHSLTTLAVNPASLTTRKTFSNRHRIYYSKILTNWRHFFAHIISIDLNCGFSVSKQSGTRQTECVRMSVSPVHRDSHGFDV